MSETSGATVETKAGLVEGLERNGVFQFRGIPFAAPSVGERRWLPPEPLEPWTGVRQAQSFGPIAPQNQMALAQLIGDTSRQEHQSEDCLFLNVFSPGLDDSRRPVLFWIHGGGFSNGSGSSPIYNGAMLSRRGNAVVVTINYRLNVLGFLRLNGITGGSIPSTGNEGILDQIAALRWVRDNIAGFGGDSGNVTIFGESAGAMSVGALLAMPEARGLFHKAILQSGAASSAQTIDRAETSAKRFIERLGLDAKDVAGLRASTSEQLQEAAKNMQGAGGLIWSPVVDGKTLPTLPLDAIANGSADGIPVLIGTTLDEGALFLAMNPQVAGLDDAGLAGFARQTVRIDGVERMIEAYRNARARRGDPVTPLAIMVALSTDNMFRIPAIRLADAHRARGNPVYSYIFTWPSPALGGKLGACHAVDIGFVFGTHADPFWGSGPAADALSRNVQDAWLAFAKRGDPNCDGLGKWPAYSDRRETMMLGERCFVQEAPFDEERHAWDSVPRSRMV